MGGAVPPLPQYDFMAWCSVRGSTGATLLTYLLTLYVCLLALVLFAVERKLLNLNSDINESHYHYDEPINSYEQTIYSDYKCDVSLMYYYVLRVSVQEVETARLPSRELAITLYTTPN